MRENTNTPASANYYAIVQRALKKQHPQLSDKENSALSREILFAPRTYKTEIEEQPVSIAKTRESMADFIERDKSAQNFIPYSLDSEIADLIEQSNCETSSMNEYYRWVSATYDILQHTGDGEITDEDLEERNKFIAISYDREAEILLCLGLYEGASSPKNKQKIDILRFKLARLRELRSIVRNTSTLTNHVHKEHLWQQYCRYCEELSQKNIPITTNFNLNLNINIDHSNDEDLDENYAYFEHIQEAVLKMMRLMELQRAHKRQAENTHKAEPATVLKQNSSSKQQDIG